MRGWLIEQLKTICHSAGEIGRIFFSIYCYYCWEYQLPIALLLCEGKVVSPATLQIES
jgi:hypothetical protein